MPVVSYLVWDSRGVTGERASSQNLGFLSRQISKEWADSPRLEAKSTLFSGNER